MRPSINVRLGQLPLLWERSALFFCNMHSIFYDNEAATQDLLNQIYGAHSYGGRVISILNLLFRGADNKIFLETPPEPHLLDYLSRDLGLSLPSFDVLDHGGYEALLSRVRSRADACMDRAVTMLKEHPAPWIDGFVTDRMLVQIADHLGKRTISTLEGSRNGNNKYLLYRHQLEKGLPVFETLLASGRAAVPGCLARLADLGYRAAVIKAQIGASGYGMVKLATREPRLETVPDYLFFEGPCMVQGWLDENQPNIERIGSPSIQMFLDDDAVSLFDWTDQILSDESVHEGNISPPPYVHGRPEVKDELLRQGAIAAEWLHGCGYRGAASTDFLVIERDRTAQVILCEINARITGATYPAVLARHFMPNGHWIMRNLQLREPSAGDRLLALMDAAGVLYHPQNHAGIIPFNFNLDAGGKIIKGQFLCVAESHEECSGLLTRIRDVLPVHRDNDPD